MLGILPTICDPCSRQLRLPASLSLLCPDHASEKAYRITEETIQKATGKLQGKMDLTWTLGGVVVELWELTRALRCIIEEFVKKKAKVFIQRHEPTLIYENQGGFARRFISFRFRSHRS